MPSYDSDDDVLEINASGVFDLSAPSQKQLKRQEEEEMCAKQEAMHARERAVLAQLRCRTILKGNGATFPVPGDSVAVHYTGKLADGTTFDTSISRGPFTFICGAGKVIKGWDLAVQRLSIGEKAKVHLPSTLCYGPTGAGPIPPNSDLVFTMQLLKVNDADVRFLANSWSWNNAQEAYLPPAIVEEEEREFCEEDLMNSSEDDSEQDSKQKVESKQQIKAKKPKAKKAKAKKAKSKSLQGQPHPGMPEHQVKYADGQITVVIQLPEKLLNIGDVDVDVQPSSLCVSSDAVEASFRLAVPFDVPVDDSAAVAKFSRKKHQLTVRIPCK
jgi:FK506-binding protein 1